MSADIIRKTLQFKVLESHKDGGRILINTPSVDRDRDRVLPQGAKLENYLKNPVVQWGHDYRSPSSTIGRTRAVEISAEGIIADFELRPAANDQDPQNIVRLLWDGGWVRTASVGFIPVAGKPNEMGGTDFTEWELLEWSLVPIPSNQDALRLAVKGLGVVGPVAPSHVAFQMESTPGTAKDADGADAVEPGRAWIRRLTVESDMGKQELFAAFRTHTLDVPEGATLLQMSWTTGECTEIPDPDAGKTITYKDVIFIPPLEFVGEEFGKNAVHSLSARTKPDAEMVAAPGKQWDVLELGDVVDSLPLAKIWIGMRQAGFGIDVLTTRGIASARKAVRLVSKRGRVLSAKNEASLRSAQSKLDEANAELAGVLSQLDEQPADDAGKTIADQTRPGNVRAPGADESETAHISQEAAHEDDPDLAAQILLPELQKLVGSIRDFIR